METFSAGLLRAFWLLLVPLFLVSVPHTFADEATDLTQAYKGKVFIVRNFWHGDTLRYDSAGQRIGDANLGFWTIDGLIRIEKIETSGGQLRVGCKRMLLDVKSGAFDYADARGNRTDKQREIVIDLGQESPTRDFVEAVFSKIFISDASSFEDAVPEYWKQCVRTAVESAEQKRGGCSLAPHFTELFAPASLTHGNQNPQAQLPAKAQSPAQSSGVYKSGPGISPPKVTYSPDPQYSRQARSAGREGICVLSLIVDPQGSPKNIEIARPLGFGLDEQAVSAVEQWKFNPARRGGQPVKVYANVAIQFHL